VPLARYDRMGSATEEWEDGLNPPYEGRLGCDQLRPHGCGLTVATKFSDVSLSPKTHSEMTNAYEGSGHQPISGAITFGAPVEELAHPLGDRRPACLQTPRLRPRFAGGLARMSLSVSSHG